MSTVPDIARLKQALIDARDWHTQLKAGDTGGADEILKRAEQRAPAVQAQARAICSEFGLAGGDFERWVWDVIISWRDINWVLDMVDVQQQ